MTDIVERLRSWRMDVDSPDVVYEAADEIDRLRAEIRAAAVQGVRDGMSEVQAADIYGVNRLTVRKWLGNDR